MYPDVAEETERKSKLGSSTHHKNPKVNEVHASQTGEGAVQEVKTQPRTSHPEQQLVSCIMTLYCGLDFLLRSHTTKEENLRISYFTGSKNGVARCGLKQHPTIHKETGKRNDLTKYSLPC